MLIATLASATALASTLLLAPAALAQTAASPTPAPSAAAAPPTGSDVQTPDTPSPLPDTRDAGDPVVQGGGGEGGQIVVTGSRIARQDYTAESPIVTVQNEFLQTQGPATIDQSLNTLPQFTFSSGAQTSGGGGTGASRAGGRATVNLRGLGTARTLVLIDGRRAQPSDPLGAVDLNTISTAIIGSVETITGGASAIYGSDAIAGVVNFRLNTNFTGLRLDADAGVTSRGDGASYSLAATAGQSFADDRGKVLMSVSYFNRSAAYRNDRPFFDDRLGTCCYTNGLIVADGSNLISATALRNLFANKYGTTIPSVAASLSLNRDGSVFGTTAGGPNLRLGPQDGFIVSELGSVSQLSGNDAEIQSPLERYTAFARGEFELTDGISVYGQVMYANYTTDVLSESGVLQAITTPIRVRADNPFVTPDLRTLLSSRPRPNDPFNYYFTGTRASRISFRQEYDVSQIIAGFKGRIGGLGWTYDVYGSHGRTNQDESSRGYISRQRFNDLVNGVNAAGVADGGQSICQGGYPIFGLDPISQQCADYLLSPTLNRARYTQDVLEGTLQGGLFQLPGGEVRFAAGVDYRKNTYRYDADAQFNTTILTDAVGNQTVTPPAVLGTSGANSTNGSVNVTEFYAELLVPILKDVPFFQDLSLDLAYRYSDYNSVGGVSTYKAGADWSVTDWFALRGGYSRAIRAPGVGELFGERRGVGSNIGSTAAGGGDPCDFRSTLRRGPNGAQVRALCVALGIPAAGVDGYTYNGTLISGLQSGNPDLTEETADSYTVGFVLRPRLGTPLFENLSLSVDYYNIKLKDAVGYVTTAVSFRRCFNADGTSNPSYDPTNPSCQLVVRDSAGLLSYATEPLQNLSGYNTSGVDAQIDWRINLSDLGLGGDRVALAFNSVVSYLDHYEIQTLPADPFLDFAGTIGNVQIDAFAPSHPRWKATTTGTLYLGDASFGLRWRFIDSQTNSNNVGTGLTSAGVTDRSYFDLIARIGVGERFDLHGGVTNLLDKDPPVYTGNAAVDTSTYDVIGRRFYLGVTTKF